jgi:hypothetical protein
MMPWWAYPLLILGMITGLAVLGFSAVRSVGTHDVQTCKCDRCQHIRTKAFLRKEAERKQKALETGGNTNYTGPTETNSNWLSTAELSDGMALIFHETPYRVNRVRIDQRGYLLELTNMENKRRSVVTVAFSLGDRRYWRPYDGRELPPPWPSYGNWG